MYPKCQSITYFEKTIISTDFVKISSHIPKVDKAITDK